nr:MAG TPA: hypothetical protein [Caudoviricetes sp.]
MESLMLGWWQVNKHFFYEKRGASRPQKPNQKPIGWGVIIQTLIANGHHFGAIGGYTERQIELFYHTIVKSQHAQKADIIEAINLGFNGGKETTQYLKDLRNGAF